MAKRFVSYSNTKQEFISAGLATTYHNSIVFIKGDAQGNGSCIYTHGQYFANFAELLAAVNYVKGINVNGKEYNAAAGGGYIPFAASDPATVTVDATEKGVVVGFNDTYKGTINTAISDINNVKGDYIPKSYKTTIEGLVSAADDKAQGAQDDVDTLAGNVGSVVNLSTTNKTVVGAINEIDGEVGSVDSLLTTNKTVVGAINEVLAAVGTGGTAAVVTLTKSEDGLTYTLKQGETNVGTINIPKDMVVESGKYENGNLVLTIANGGGDVTIPVGDLIDLYTGGSNAQIAVAVDEDNKITATLVAGGVSATELAANAVTTAKIADKNVTEAKLSQDVQNKLQFATTERNGLMTADDKKMLNSLPESIPTTLDEIVQYEDQVDISFSTVKKTQDGYVDGEYLSFDIKAATNTSAGVMTAADKVKLDNLDETFAWEEL